MNTVTLEEISALYEKYVIIYYHINGVPFQTRNAIFCYTIPVRYMCLAFLSCSKFLTSLATYDIFLQYVVEGFRVQETDQ